MKKIVLTLFSLLFFIFNTSFANTYNADPKLFITELINDAINTLSSKTLSKEDKESFIEKIAVENVDINALGLYTLGEIRKSTKEDDLTKYQETFQKYFLKSLTSRLTDYSSNKLEVITAEIKSSNYTIIKSKIVANDKQAEVKIDWRVYTKNPEKPLIRDLIVEGLSLARTQKEEFASILNSNNNNINILIVKLEEFLND
jgi:phospholipid transport system substrate-binding protein